MIVIKLLTKNNFQNNRPILVKVNIFFDTLICNNPNAKKRIARKASMSLINFNKSNSLSNLYHRNYPNQSEKH